MMEGRSWCWPMFAGFVITLAGQTLINLFVEGLSHKPLIPIPGTYLILAGSLATGFGSAWFSRSSPGLFRGLRPTTKREAFFFEALVTAVMVLLTNMCGWLAVEAVKVAVNPAGTSKDRLLSIPLVVSIVLACAAALLLIAAYARHQPGTPSPLVEGTKNMIRSFPPWKWIAKPRENWHPTRVTVAGMHTLLYAGLLLRVAAGIAIGATVSEVLATPGKRELADLWSSGGFIASLFCAGIGLSIAGLPEKLLPERNVSRGRQVVEEVANVAISGLALVVIPSLIVQLRASYTEHKYSPLMISIVGALYVVAMVVLWGLSTLTQRSINSWAKPAFIAKNAKKAAKKKVRKLKRNYAELNTSDDESEKARNLAAEEIASADAKLMAAEKALQIARGGKK